jgi:hypothetical protein
MAVCEPPTPLSPRPRPKHDHPPLPSSQAARAWLARLQLKWLKKEVASALMLQCAFRRFRAIREVGSPCMLSITHVTRAPTSPCRVLSRTAPR